ncbi:hypothetical protein [Paraburkholderia atlantica]|uniref:hypothetical protein n=1 Tax=Paraburkholderia atlantica TaxID=2654982 RepID=UPI00187B6D21|nr:hypothetical protein [Paraburkholderia atlantica]
MIESRDGHGLDGGYYTIGGLKDGLIDGAVRRLERCCKSPHLRVSAGVFEQRFMQVSPM